MPLLNVTSSEIRTASQNIQKRFVKLELLNYQYQPVDEISGICNAGTATIDANSDIRRTASLSLTITDSSFEVESGGKIWLDKYIRLYVGTEDLVNGEIAWTNYGMYIIDSPSYEYNATNNTLTLSLLDMMAKLTGVRNGYLPGIPTVLKKDENIRKAIIDTLALGGFTKYVVEEAPSPGTIPFDIELKQGSTIYDILLSLKELYPFHEMFFDVNGTFYYKQIPTGKNDPVIIDDSLFDYIVSSEKIEPDFQNVKNSIEVYGRTQDPKHYAPESTVSGNVLILNIASLTEYSEDVIYGFTLKDNPGYTSLQVKINNMTAYPLKLDDGTTDAQIVAESGEVYYCIQFKKTYWLWLGHFQAYGKAEDTNPESPFNINSTIGRIHLPLYDGEYANCYTDELAQQRAEYELWLHTNMNNTLTLDCVPVYWLDVNLLTEYTLKRNGVKSKYLIKSINIGFAPSDRMSLTMIKFYPEPEET